MAANDLRPLGLGELLDRAVTLFVRHFRTIALTLAVAYVPFLVLQAALVGRILVRKPTSLGRDEWLAVGLDVAVGVVVFALTRTAVAAIAHAAYMSQNLSVGAAYRLAARCFLAQIVTFLVAGLLWIVILLAATLAFIVIGVSIGGGSEQPIATTIAFVIAAAAGAVVSAWLYLGLELGTVRIAIGTRRPYGALFEALAATVFRRPWQSLLAAVTLLLVALGGSLVSSALVELIPSVTLRTVVSFTVSSVESILFEGLAVAFVVVFAVDVMVRREGLDLAVALDAAPPTAGAP